MSPAVGTAQVLILPALLLVQDPDAFIADGGWNFLDQEGGSDEEEDEEEVLTLTFSATRGQAVMPSVFCPFSWCAEIRQDWHTAFWNSSLVALGNVQIM